ncbi:MAG: molybdenum cofactor guanylyltransferase MobA [Candidatus Igneacidithiobacillus chanchocoensis]
MSRASEHLLLPVTGLLLAGGAGRRMGGEDKGWIEYRGTALATHALRPLERYAREILISANRNHERYAALGYPVVADAETGFAGPLQGILAGLAAAHFDWLAVVPVDAPHLPDDLLWQLWQLRRGVPLVVARDEHDIIPVIALLHRRLLSLLQRFVTSGQRRAGDFFATIPQQQLRLRAEELRNCNTPADLQEPIA